MARSKEYRGEPLAELAGKTKFVCECCVLKRSIVSLDVHHIISQAAGGGDERENLALLDKGCHDALHRIASSMAGIRKGKRPAYELAEEYAKATNEKNWEVVRDNILTFAAKVAQGIALKKKRAIEGGDVDTPLTLPPKFNALFKQAARTVKGAGNKPIGKARLLQVMASQFLMKQYPDMRDEIHDWMYSEVLGHPKQERASPMFMGITRT